MLTPILEKHSISDRIMAITTDNASNNETLVSSLQQAYPDTSITRVPCMAHVIQLSLKQLLGIIKVNPNNDNIELVWSEELQKHREFNHMTGISRTLQKVRNLAVYINASPQRRDDFWVEQAKDGMKDPLYPIQDVRTRWNSTFLMLERALRIRPALDSYCKLNWVKMRIRSDEWRQITYLLHITKPFFVFTTALCKTKDITIYSVFNIYNALFQHIESSMTKLQRKKLCSSYIS
jgi:hypothetical protein